MSEVPLHLQPAIYGLWTAFGGLLLCGWVLLITRRREEEKMSDWQPIITAPKANIKSSGFDSLVGPRIIVANDEYEAEVYWCEEIDMDDGDGGTQILGEGWFDVAESEHITWLPKKWRHLTTSSLPATETPPKPL